jgi:AcrR family transcriptional regulator
MVFLEGALVTEHSDLPRAIRALWGLDDASGRRGPKRTLSVPAIGAAAVEVADAQGLSAVSMASVAERLGTTAMSLYRYLDSKRELEVVMVDLALGPPPTRQPRRSWRRELEDWARAEVRQLAAHPWALDVRTGSPQVTPNLLAWTDVGMQIVLRSGLAEQPASSALLLVDGFARQHVLRGLQFSDPEGTTAWADHLRQVLDPAAMPGLARVLASGALEDGDPEDFPGDEELEFGLALLLDGIEALARREVATR